MNIKVFKYLFFLIFIFLWYRALFNNEERVSYSILGYLKKNDNKYTTKFCHVKMSNLSLQTVELDIPVDFKKVEFLNRDVKIGGHWRPTDCISRQKVAVILPYRSREHQLHTLIKRLHAMLKQQKIEYTIFVVNQVDDENFNRGMILNVGVVEAMKLSKFDCIVFNDVDLVPEHDANLYMCDDGVRQISSAIDDTRYHVMFWNNAGGVVSIKLKNYLKINGHPNLYWGWGNEDDDFSVRTALSGLRLSRPPEHIGRFKMVKHMRGFRNAEAYWLFRSFEGRWRQDGISSLLSLGDDDDIDVLLASNASAIRQPHSPYVPFLSPYRLVEVAKQPLYTNVSVILTRVRQQNLRHTPHTWKSLHWMLSFYGWI